MYSVPSSLTLLTYAPGSPMYWEAIVCASCALILLTGWLWLELPPLPVLDPPFEEEPELPPLPVPVPPLLLPPLLPLPPLLGVVLAPVELPESVPWFELLPNKSPKPLLPESEPDGVNPVKSLKTALFPSLIP